MLNYYIIFYDNGIKYIGMGQARWLYKRWPLLANIKYVENYCGCFTFKHQW